MGETKRARKSGGEILRAVGDDIAIGTTVVYFAAPGALAVRTKTRSVVWTLGDGTPVVAIEGHTGGVALDALRLPIYPEFAKVRSFLALAAWS